MLQLAYEYCGILLTLVGIFLHCKHLFKDKFKEMHAILLVILGGCLIMKSEVLEIKQELNKCTQNITHLDTTRTQVPHDR